MVLDFIEILKVIFLGIVEGITEWLPISSTGHMILLNEIVSLNVSDEFYSMFEVVIQLGAILAVVILFWNQIWPFGKKDNKEPLAKTGAGAYIKWDIFKLWFHILVSCVPAAIVGVLFDEQLEALFYNYQTVAIMLILFGVAFIVIENYHKGKKAKVNTLVGIDYKLAFWIGMFQLIAAIFQEHPVPEQQLSEHYYLEFPELLQRNIHFPCNPGYVWSQSFERCQSFDERNYDFSGRCNPCGGNGCCICSVARCN